MERSFSRMQRKTIRILPHSIVTTTNRNYFVHSHVTWVPSPAACQGRRHHFRIQLATPCAHVRIDGGERVQHVRHVGMDVRSAIREQPSQPKAVDVQAHRIHRCESFIN